MRRRSIGFATLVLGLAATLSYAQAPVPFINQPLVPDAVAPGGPDFTLTVNGTGFVSKSTVKWNGSPLDTTFVSGSKLTATVPAADVATASTAWVTVVNPAPGGSTSNVAFFTVTDNRGSAVAFRLASSPATGLAPYSVVVGDFNRDGKLDLAVANGLDDTVSVLLGDGMGSFSLASTPATGAWPYSPAVGDFNGDGKLDLAVANEGSNTVSVLLGDGAGNFTLASSPGVGSAPTSVAAGDFNGDGNLDLAVANYWDGTVSVLLGDGTGNFTLASSLAPGVNSASVAVGDFNGDGWLDLAVAIPCGSDPNCESGGTVSVLLGDGAGNFTLVSSPPAGSWPWSMAVGDFNGDGKLDLATANTNSNDVSILLGDGRGNFTLASSPAVGSAPDTVAVGDFNGDGKLDLVTGYTWDNAVSILLGDGTGNFTLASSPGVGQFPSSVAVGDFNGDGKLDAAVANVDDNTVSILLQLPPGPFITLSPTSVNFGAQLVFTGSAPRSVTLTSIGTETLDIISIVASSSFLELNNCGSSLTVGASCNINVFFSPHVPGTITETVTITDNASDSPQTISLTGAGTMVGLSPPTLHFNTQTVGTTSTAQTVTMTNHSSRTLNVYGFGFRGSNPGDFAQTNTCGNSLAAGASCTISVTFTPQAKGSRNATLNVVDNGGGSPQTVTLKGYGI